MISWSRVLAIFMKELVQMRRDRLTFVIMVSVPIMQLILFGYAINTFIRTIMYCLSNVFVR